jgi:hypothetical protein
MTDSEPRAWTLTNTMLAAMGAIILILLGFGFNSITNQIKDGDYGINQQLIEIKQQNKETGHQLLEMTRIITILKTNQDIRLERERLESERKARITN